jgi:hypothetical protein
MKETKYWATVGESGRVEIALTLEQAHRGYHSGQCDADIAELLLEPEIAAQMNAIDRMTLAKELQCFGAWTIGELMNHEANKARALWNACAEIVENENDRGVIS